MANRAHKGRTLTCPPLVSVVLIFFNTERFLREAVESVLTQSYPQWELFLVDDGSTDGSSSIAQEYAQQLPLKIRYLEHPGHANQGAAAARNLGLKGAKGRYVAFLDSDDVWLPDKLAQQVNILEAHSDVAMVYGRDQWWYSWDLTALGRHDWITELGVAADSVYGPPILLRLSLASQAPTPSPSNLMARLELVQKVGGFEEHFRGIYQLYEDHAFLAKVYLTASVFVANECWIKYRRHSGSCMSQVERSGKRSTAALYYLDWLADYMKKHGIGDEELMRAHRARQFYWRHPFLCRVGSKIRSWRNQKAAAR